MGRRKKPRIIHDDDDDDNNNDDDAGLSSAIIENRIHQLEADDAEWVPNGGNGTTGFALDIDSVNIHPNKRQRISLVNKASEGRGQGSLATFSAAAEEDRNGDRPEGEEPFQWSATEYKTHLSSLHEIISKSFDPERAFTYNFINVMNTFLRSTGQDRIDFKLLALSLEAGTKVYTSKIDTIYRHTQKVFSTLTMATDKHGQTDGTDGDDDTDDGDEDAQQERAKVSDLIKKRRKQKASKTIATNLKSEINGKFETNVLPDPVFHLLSSTLNAGEADTLLMATLLTDPNGQLLLDSSASFDFSKYPQLSKQQQPTFTDSSLVVGVIQEDLSRGGKDLRDSHICGLSTFRDYDFLNRDTADIMSPPKDDLTNDYEFELNAEVEDVEEGDGFDWDDPFARQSDEQRQKEAADEEARAAAARQQAINLLKVLPADENHFFNRNFLRNTFRRVKMMDRDQMMIKKEPKPRKPRATFEANAYRLAREDFSIRDHNRLSAQVLEKWIFNNFQIRNHYGFNAQMLRQIFGRTKTYFYELPIPKASRPLTGDYSDDNNSSDDDNDSFYTAREGLGSEHGDGNSLPDRLKGVDDDDEDFPDFVDPLEIDYIKVAKRINIKSVKKAMWDSIVRDLKENFQTTSTTTSNCDTSLRTSTTTTTPIAMDEQQSTSTNDQQTPQLTFSVLRKTLPKYLKPDLNDNLSIANSFVALLHLCNEKTLALSLDENPDIIIQNSSS